MEIQAARVIDIILDDKHPKYKIMGEEEAIGKIYFTFVNNYTPINNSVGTLRAAKPLYYSISHYPLPNEIVHVLGAPNDKYNESGAYDWYYMPPISIHKNASHNASPNVFSDDPNEPFYMGRYFKSKENVRPLRPYEGDIMIEGRFGQSIRFGSTINHAEVSNPNFWSEGDGGLGNPITIIRNGQMGEDKWDAYDEPYKHIIEDINKDDSSIWLCSNQKISNFTPASIHEESYLADNPKPKTEEKLIQPNNPLPNTPETENITFAPAPSIPPEELQNTKEIDEETDPDTAGFDIALTETDHIIPANETTPDAVNVPENITIPDFIDFNQLITPIDNLTVYPYNVPHITTEQDGGQNYVDTNMAGSGGTESGGGSGLPTYQEAWNNMTPSEQAQYGSYSAFVTAAEQWWADNPQ